MLICAIAVGGIAFSWLTSVEEGNSQTVSSGGLTMTLTSRKGGSSDYVYLPGDDIGSTDNPRLPGLRFGITASGNRAFQLRLKVDFRTITYVNEEEILGEWQPAGIYNSNPDLCGKELITVLFNSAFRANTTDQSDRYRYYYSGSYTITAAVNVPSIYSEMHISPEADLETGTLAVRVTSEMIQAYIVEGVNTDWLAASLTFGGRR